MTDYKIYQSPFSWRYGTEPMRLLWSEHHKRLLWREIWVALAEVQESYGLVTPEQSADLRAHMNDVDMERSLAIEQEIVHDLMAEIRVFAEQAKLGGAILHLGATSMDVEDNADAIRLRQSLDLTLTRLASFLDILVARIGQYAESPLIAYTHLQPAVPSTLGYRIAVHAQDLFEDVSKDIPCARTRFQIPRRSFPWYWEAPSTSFCCVSDWSGRPWSVWQDEL